MRPSFRNGTLLHAKIHCTPWQHGSDETPVVHVAHGLWQGATNRVGSRTMADIVDRAVTLVMSSALTD